MSATSRHPSLKVIVTGGRGRLAACIRPHLTQAGHEVVLLSRTEGAGYLPTESFFLTSLPEQADVVLHLAWSSLPANSERNIGIEWEQDLPLLFRILRRIADSPARDRTQFIFFSSGGSVYGPGIGRPVREDDPCRPIGWYAQAKVAAEEIVQAFAARHGVACTILRVSNPYGFSVPEHRAQGIIPHAFACARSGRPLSVWGDGSARKDFIHASDFNRALEAVIAHRLTGIYNLASGQSHSVREVLSHVERITGRTLKLEHGPARTWDVQTSLLDSGKLKAATGWSPQVSFEQGLRLTAAELGV
ncbi:NAD-dependent epimerase/dehydratase family protein [Opitutaceae bacterium]